ncbi:hypothetical protein FOA52_010649 [Chlamydomonas sp. UWO 241]|nr:hypothetical protein FOA52_010649 [Chlamydomonas sp. UWO 241]
MILAERGEQQLEAIMLDSQIELESNDRTLNAGIHTRTPGRADNVVTKAGRSPILFMFTWVSEDDCVSDDDG